MNLLIKKFTREGEDDLDYIDNSCFKCNSPHSLIVLDKKQRVISDDRKSGIALVKIQCIRCNWKFMKDFLWENTPH